MSGMLRVRKYWIYAGVLFAALLMAAALIP